MNCSQKLISLIFGTTSIRFWRIKRVLWIALKSWYLWYSEQRTARKLWAVRVVNCSQKLISLIFGTTDSENFSGARQLWIALKSWYLWYSEQRYSSHIHVSYSCELLSKVDIFDIRNNLATVIVVVQELWIALKSWYLWYSEQQGSNFPRSYKVVNCSQKLISLIFGTTHVTPRASLDGLWIALKSWYLWYSEQQTRRTSPERDSCELLSKVDIFDIRNNS